MARAAIGKIKRETLSGQASTRIDAWMRRHSLRPGDALPSQAELAEQLGVSRTVIREALQSLVGKGIVQVINGKGAVMRPVSNEPLSIYFRHSLNSKNEALVEMMEVRRALEVQAAALAPVRRTSDQLAGMQCILREMRLCGPKPECYADLDLRLHLAFAEATQNDMLSHLIASIRDAARDAILAGLKRQPTETDRNRIQAAHEAMVAAVEQRASARMVSLMEKHFDGAIEMLSRK